MCDCFFLNPFYMLRGSKNYTTIKELYKKPPNEKETPHLRVYEPNIMHEVDVLYFTNDGGFKYLLVVVDVHNGLVEARALQTLDMEDVTMALEDIYERSKYFNTPQVIQGDHEFDSKIFRDWCNRMGVKLKITEAGESRQNAHVESVNRIIGSELWKLQVNEEIETGKPYTKWRKWYPVVLAELNEKRLAKLDKQRKRIKEEPEKDSIVYTKSNKYIIADGTRVRLKLNHPETIQGKKLQGDFRATDHRYRFQPTYEVVRHYEMPGSVPLYEIKRTDNGKLFKHLLSIEQLQIIKN